MEGLYLQLLVDNHVAGRMVPFLYFGLVVVRITAYSFEAQKLAVGDRVLASDRM